MLTFWKAVADEVEDGHADSAVDYGWIFSEILPGPVLGPPIPMSMRAPLDRALHQVYAPGLMAQINNSRSLLWRIGAESNKAEWLEPPS